MVESLKANSSLTELNLGCDEQMIRNEMRE